MSNLLTFSHHAITRMAQRGLSANDVVYVVDHGQCIRCAGVRHYVLRKRDIPISDLSNKRYARLEGTTVLMDPKLGDSVITVYRNRLAIKAIRRKEKYDRTSYAYAYAALVV